MKPYSIAYVPCRCRKCGATFQEPACYMSECMFCDDAKTEPMLWHEYVRSLKQYNPNFPKDKIEAVARDLESEWYKLGRYIETMSKLHKDFNGTETVNESNMKARDIAVDLEEELWS